MDDFITRLQQRRNRRFKFLICKVVKDGITIIDHLLEFVISHYDSEPLGLGITIPEEPPEGSNSVSEYGTTTNNLLNNNYQGSIEHKIRSKQVQEISFSDRVKVKEKFYID